MHPYKGLKTSAPLFVWLAHNRRAGQDDRIFSDAEDNILEEILRIDDGDLFGGDNMIANRTPNWSAIVAAFRGAHFFDAPFIRGDADGDGRLNLADALGVLNFLFANGTPNLDCVNALDANDRDGVDLKPRAAGSGCADSHERAGRR